MFSLFTDLLYNSMLLSPIILLLLLISKFGYKKYRSDIRYILWVAVGVFLAFPSIFKNILIWFFNKIVPVNIFATDYSAVTRAFGQIEQLTRSDYLQNGTGYTGTSSLSYLQLTASLYFAVGVIICLVRFGKYIFYRNKLNRWRLKITDKNTIDLFVELKDELNIEQVIMLKKSSEVSSPMLIGFLNPTIFLPEKQLTQKELGYILTHELTHYKNKDLWSQLFFMIITCCYWINPLIWLMENQVEVDIEIKCDNNTLKRFKTIDRREYSYSLLSFINENNNKPFENLSMIPSR